jgi:hypothetical protein
VEFLKSGAVAGREVASVVPAEEIGAVAKGPEPKMKEIVEDKGDHRPRDAQQLRILTTRSIVGRHNVSSPSHHTSNLPAGRAHDQLCGRLL